MTSTAAVATGVVHSLFDAINAHDLQRMRTHWTAETTERFPDRTVHGPDELSAYFEAVFAAMPDWEMRVRAVAEDGETVFVRWEATGTHTGAPFQGIKPTGKSVHVDGVDHFTIRDGHVASNFVIFDQMDVGRQLGLLPPDGSAPDRALKAGFNALLAARGRFSRG
jgi:steroid delta-isomerase-like uncharacterized protein